MAYWLVKSEPESFSLEHLRKKKRSPWDGVRNYQARNNLRAMRLGEICIFYHSNAKPSGAVGLCRVVREHYPDHTAWDPADHHYDPKDGPEVQRWSMVDMAFERAFARFLPLDLLREDGELRGLVLFSASRLSVQPVSDAHFARICELGGSSACST